MANLGFLKFLKTALEHKLLLSSIVLLTVMFSGCAGSTTFRVLDAETKEPIEGAVALATWTKTRGLPGLTSRYTAKAVEVVTGPDGIFRIPVVLGTLALQKPHLKVYKPGYVGWDSLRIYLGCYEKNRTLSRTKRREGFSMKNQDIYLDPWKETYTFISHGSFVSAPVGLHEGGINDSKYIKATDYEIPLRIKERNLLQKERK